LIARYRILLQIELRHEFYRDGGCPDLDARPSRSTADLLRRLGLLWKVVDDSMLVLARVDEDGKPERELPANAKFTFYLNPADALFMNVTNVDNARLRGERFLFGNLAANAVGTELNLSARIPAYDAARAYLPGDLASLGAADVYECIKAGQGQTPSAPGSAFWASRAQVQYVSAADLIPFRSSASEFKLAVPANAFEVQVLGLDAATGLYTVPVREARIIVSALETQDSVKPDLSGLPSGRYRIRINGQVFDAYLDDEAVDASAFAAVEIFNHLAGADPYSLLDAAGKAKQTRFRIRFANRLAYWKYLTPDHKVTTILNSGAAPGDASPFQPDPATPGLIDTFTSLRPLPLTQDPARNRFDLHLQGDVQSAPRPNLVSVGAVRQAFDPATQTWRDFFCDIHLNFESNPQPLNP
jgi:hypothetical protein